MYERRGEQVFNKVSSRFDGIENIVFQMKDSLDILEEGFGKVRLEALSKLQYMLMDNNPRHGVSPEFMNRINIAEKAKSKSQRGFPDLEEILDDLMELTFGVMEKKINTFIDMFSEKVYQV